MHFQWFVESISGPKKKVVRAVYKSGTGTRGQGHGDACVGTWDLGLGDARRGTWGHQVWDAGSCGMGTQGLQTQGYMERGDDNDYLKSQGCFGEGNPPCPPYGSSMPVYEAKTLQRSHALKKVKPLSWSSCWWKTHVPCIPVFDIPAFHTWCPQVPRLASPSLQSPHTCPHVPVPLSPSHFYTQPDISVVSQTLLTMVRFFGVSVDPNFVSVYKNA